MLRIYKVAVEMCRDAGRNIAEGAGSYAGHRKQRYHTALGSAHEVVASYDAAEAIGPVVRSRLDEIIGTMINVLRLRR